VRLLYRSNFSRYLVDWIQFELNPPHPKGRLKNPQIFCEASYARVAVGPPRGVIDGAARDRRLRQRALAQPERYTHLGCWRAHGMARRSIGTAADSFAAAACIQQAAAILRRFLSHLQARNKDSKPRPKTNQYFAEFGWSIDRKRSIVRTIDLSGCSNYKAKARLRLVAPTHKTGQCPDATN
jgi:hypothetical protein